MPSLQVRRSYLDDHVFRAQQNGIEKVLSRSQAYRAVVAERYILQVLLDLEICGLVARRCEAFGQLHDGVDRRRLGVVKLKHVDRQIGPEVAAPWPAPVHPALREDQGTGPQNCGEA